jgi:hypothetical protein
VSEHIGHARAFGTDIYGPICHSHIILFLNFYFILFFSFLPTFSNLPQPSRRPPTHSLPAIDAAAAGRPRHRSPSLPATDDLAARPPCRPTTKERSREISGRRRPATKGEDLCPATYLLRRLLLPGAAGLLLPAARVAEHRVAPSSRAPPRRSPGGPYPLAAAAALPASAMPSRMHAPLRRRLELGSRRPPTCTPTVGARRAQWMRRPAPDPAHARAPHWADFFSKIGSTVGYTPSLKRMSALFVSADQPKRTELDRFEHLNRSARWRYSNSPP